MTIDEAIERINVLRRAMIMIKRESHKGKPNPDDIYAYADKALRETE